MCGFGLKYYHRASVGCLPTQKCKPNVRPPGLYDTNMFSALYKIFRAYLVQLVEQTEDVFCITFKAGIPDVPIEVIEKSQRSDQDGVVNNLELRVLTPAFYLRLIHYVYTSEAIDRECVFTDEKNRILWMCRPQLLPLLLSAKSSFDMNINGLSVTRRGYMDELRWRFLRRLRCSPADAAQSMTLQSSVSDVRDIRSRPYSELDNFVRTSGGNAYAAEYRRAVTKIFLARRFCFGFSRVVGLVDLSLRVLLCYLGALQLKIWSKDLEMLSPVAHLQEMMSQNAREQVSNGPRQWCLLSNGVFLMFSCHAYQMSKGYK